MSSARPIHILLIEDNPGDARLIREMLVDACHDNLAGYYFDVVWIDRVEAALAYLDAGAVDLILMDLSLPDSQGLDTVLRICEHALACPIVVLTALADESLALKAVGQGAQDYLLKNDADSETLVRAIHYAIERHRLQVELYNMSLTDDLTGLYNRRGFLTLANQQLKLARRRRQSLMVVYADLDDLKLINDSYGHHEGSQALVETADVLRQTFRDSDILARIGGDEFTVLVVDAADDCCDCIGARLLENLERHNIGKNGRYQISLSVGFARFDSSSTLSIEELIANADAAMYAQKREKRRSRSIRL